jgi:hypothetical protein
MTDHRATINQNSWSGAYVLKKKTASSSAMSPPFAPSSFVVSPGAQSSSEAIGTALERGSDIDTSDPQADRHAKIE